MKMKFKKLFIYALIAVFGILGTSEIKAQENNAADFKDFLVTIEKTKDGVKLYNSKGSAWTELSFTLKPYVPQAIDEYGMADLGQQSIEKDPKFADFLFTIMKTEKGILLKGLEGTAWTELSFSMKEYGRQNIDQFGMAE